MPRISLCVALLLALVGPVSAQTGRVFGAVTDPSGAVLPAVEVRAVMRDASGQTIRTVATDAKGRFEIDSLAPGTWSLSLILAGFETATRQVTIQNGEAQEWSATLALGTLEETITVTAAPTGRPLPQEAAMPVVPAAAAPPAQAAPPGTIRVGGSIKPPRKIVHVNPVYPPDAAAQKIGGVVILNAVIGPDGFIREITPVSSPSDSFTTAATGAVNSWRFTPTLLNGEAVPVRMVVTLHFNAQG